MTRCDLCGFEREDIRERDDDQGRPYLICESCYENLGNDSYEPTEPEEKAIK